MSFEVVDQITNPGAAFTPNEDALGFNEVSAWVVDGATGVFERPVVSHESDAKWLASRVDEGLRDFSDMVDVPLVELMADVSAYVSIAFVDDVIDPSADPSTYPTASFVVARAIDGVFEYMSGGDCRAIYRSGGKTNVFGGDLTAALLEERAESLIASYLGEGLSHREAREKSLGFVRQARSLVNTKDGYWVFGVESDFLDHVSWGALPYQSGDEVLLLSDGLYRLVDKFGVYESASDLFDAAKSRGLEALISELRDIEKSDASCKAAPRMKVSDDATGMLLRLV